MVAELWQKVEEMLGFAFDVVDPREVGGDFF